jgi:hypothetical protein
MMVFWDLKNRSLIRKASAEPAMPEKRAQRGLSVRYLSIWEKENEDQISDIFFILIKISLKVKLGGRRKNRG